MIMQGIDVQELAATIISPIPLLSVKKFSAAWKERRRREGTVSVGIGY